MEKLSRLKKKLVVKSYWAILKHPCGKRTHLVDTFMDRNRIVAIGTPILYSAAYYKRLERATLAYVIFVDSNCDELQLESALIESIS